MRQFIKKKIRKILHPVILRLGYQLYKPEQTDSLLENFFLILQNLHFQPRHIVDVGANHGNWTRSALKYFPNAEYSLLEPQQWLEASIQDVLKSNPNVKFYPVGAGKTRSLLKFTLVERDDSCTFVISEREAAEHGYKQIDVEVVTLNEFLAETNLPAPDIIKIDAEGFDLEVLDGADSFFGKTEIFIVEAAVVAKIKNTVAAVIHYMKERGYKLFELTDLNRPYAFKVLWLLELVFVRENGFIDSQNAVQNPLSVKAHTT